MGVLASTQPLRTVEGVALSHRYVNMSFAMSPKALRQLLPSAEALAEQDNDGHTKTELCNWRNLLWSVLDKNPEPEDELSFLD